MINNKRLINEFMKLLKIESISLQEKEMATYLVKAFKKIGYKATQDNVGKKIEGQVNNIFINIKGNVRKAPKVFLNAHIDTVNLVQGVEPVIKKGKVISANKTALGADDKAGIAAILEIVRTIKEKELDHGDIQIIFTVAEEIGLFGAKAMKKKNIQADFGFSLDGGSAEKIINQAPAQINVDITIIGKAAHAGVHPEEGINAIKIASQAIAKMKIGRIDKETTANIGLINGGQAKNIVPAKVKIQGEARSHDPIKLKRQINHMHKCIKLACDKNRAKYIIKAKPIYKSFCINQKSPVLKYVSQAAKKQKIKISIMPTGGGSDANIFNAMGIPALIIGVGAHRPHDVGEYIHLKDLIKGTNFMLSILLEVAGG